MAEGRFALIIANSDYTDPDLKRLTSPAQQAKALEKVLKDPKIGSFEVKTMINEPNNEIMEEIELFFSERKPDDLLLLYFSCHGVTDDYTNELYFTTVNTRRKQKLRSTAIQSGWVKNVMEKSRSDKQVVLLDCCYSGAFLKGTMGDNTEVHAEKQLKGRGRAVMTASTAMQFAFEDQGNTIKILNEAGSYFTDAILEGLEEGKADDDYDGSISFDDLYNYVYEYVRDKTQNVQTPTKSAVEIRGKIEIAKNPKWTYFLGGNKFLGLGQYREAIKCYTKALEIEPRNANAWNNKGRSLDELGLYKGALSCYTKALEIDPNHNEAKNNKDNILSKLFPYTKQPDVTVPTKRTAVEAVMMKALDLFEFKDYTNALLCLNQAVEIDPKNAQGYFYQGNVFAKLENYQEAKKSYQKALELAPNTKYASEASRRLAMITRYVETKEKGDEPKANDIHKKIQRLSGKLEKRDASKPVSLTDRVAIVIGINQYEDSTIPKLPGAEYDAKEISERLEDPNRCNFKIQSYLVGKDAKCAAIRKAINNAFWRTDSHDLVLFYFSGHAFVDGYNDGYIAPYDMVLDEPFAFGINIRELGEIISKSKNKNVVMILDCCYSGIPTNGGSAPPTQEDFEKHLALSGEGRIILASSQPNQRSKEIEVPHGDNLLRHPHGSFTFHLLQGLDGEASDKNTGIITLGGLHEYIEGKMKNESQQQPKFSVTEGGQLNGIQIAVVPELWQKKRHIIINEIKYACDRRDQIFTLFRGAQKVNELTSLDPNNIHIYEFREAITASLQSYTGMIVNWLTSNAPDVGPRIAKYDDLYNLENYLYFDKFVKMDPVQLNRLSALCDVINGKDSIDIFVLRLTPRKSSLSNRMDGGLR